MAKNNKKIYVLEICYDTEKGEVEYIEEFVTSYADKPAIIPFPDELEVEGDEYWEFDTNEIGES